MKWNPEWSFELVLLSTPTSAQPRSRKTEAANQHALHRDEDICKKNVTLHMERSVS